MRAPAYIYARALWSWALAHNAVPKTEQHLKKLCDVVGKALTEHPQRLTRTSALIISDKTPFDRWMGILIRNRRLDLIPDIYTHFRSWSLATEGMEVVTVEVPHTISTDQEMMIQAVVQKKFDHPVSCTFVHNQKLVLGFRVWFKQYLWDVSWGGWVNRMMNQL